MKQTFNSQFTVHMDTHSKHLLLHGAIVLFFGLLLGAPYAKAIKRDAPAHIVNSWRVAHAALPMGGIMMMVFALVLPVLSVSSTVKWAIAASLIISAYGFSIALPLSAIKGERSLQRGMGWGQVVYIGNMVGAAGSLISSTLFLLTAIVNL
jgi:hypothetical protein